MTKDEAKREALRRWRELPPSERQTDRQAAEFAMKLHLSWNLRFRNSADGNQHIKGWLMDARGEP
ncbi:hypothetical protein [Methylobacterium frigidaeris]|uniref:Uncharacterized protein n=1 Tax=Methylobacterium frigidaeris TaxID=2038277 RepID=A0AA37HJH7_9HYPH|nr:hypothetical protein [Methylobacterium frigidaeris]GJD66285.1 hypothetical protein MPEAHAMD_6482 [Methylobacterium frigidaeris]